jgi:hypothetical protein
MFVLAYALTACSIPGSTPEPVVGSLPTVSTEDPTQILPTMTSPDPQESCLNGNWVMPTDTLDLLVATLFPVTSPFLSVRGGELSISFQDGLYTYEGEYQFHVDTTRPGEYSDATSTFTTTGAYTILPASKVLFDESSSTTQMTSCTSTKDGTTYTADCSSIGGFSILLPAEAPFRCSANSLEIDTLSPTGGTITMFFVR